MPNVIVSRDSHTFGPYTVLETRTLLDRAELQPSDSAWTEGLIDWAPLGEVLGALEQSPGGCEPDRAVFTDLSYRSSLPEGVGGWCWGAFLLGPVWAIGNRVWPGLAAWIPGLNILVQPWLGHRGRALAWRQGGWKSVEEFRKAQSRWTVAGLALLFVGAMAQRGWLAALDTVARAEVVSHGSGAESPATSAHSPRSR
jgi:hypothetical protein